MLTIQEDIALRRAREDFRVCAYLCALSLLAAAIFLGLAWWQDRSGWAAMGLFELGQAFVCGKFARRFARRRRRLEHFA